MMATTVVQNQMPVIQNKEGFFNGEDKDGKKEFKGKIVQITNVSPGTTLQQIATLFGYLGTVTDIRIYPSKWVHWLSLH